MSQTHKAKSNESYAELEKFPVFFKKIYYS